MLVVTRKVGEEIRIGDDIVVMVVAIDRGKAKIGVIAPRGVPVNRQEVYERIQREKSDADKTAEG